MKENKYRRVKWGLIGAGEFGLLYAQIMQKLPNVDIVSVYSRTEKHAREASEKFNIPKWYTDYNELIASDGVEALMIVTAEPYHLGPTMAGIAAGKHIILEKPIASKLEEADEMIAAAKKADVVFAIAHILPFHKTGEAKYKALNMKNYFQDIQVPSKERVLKVKEQFESRGFNVIIGG